MYHFKWTEYTNIYKAEMKMGENDYNFPFIHAKK